MPFWRCQQQHADDYSIKRGLQIRYNAYANLTKNRLFTNRITQDNWFLYSTVRFT
uniref:Uncharacterized protein n=1 Tax=mine drainage metagenome TaxID=410659 RepID=E6QUR6_9ZZZZ